mmetsp:Transcript_94180/g.292964  ORF Transcript_94180/g.292964 Transcript_94180/m.292964 type:complete len:89 (+) Transcript_94180:220-486(+)
MVLIFNSGGLATLATCPTSGIRRPIVIPSLGGPGLAGERLDRVRVLWSCILGCVPFGMEVQSIVVNLLVQANVAPTDAVDNFKQPCRS